MATDKSQLKVKKKTWCPVFTNKPLGETFIGEIPLTDSNLLVGRCIESNLMNITGNPKNQNINIKFRIEKVVGTKGIAYPVMYTMVSSTIKRLVRRTKDRLDDSFLCTTSDGIKVRIKPLYITKSHTTDSVRAAIRKASKEFILSAATNSNYLTLFTDIINSRFQRFVRSHLKKLYPLAICEIRALEVVHGQALSNASEETKRAPELIEKRVSDERQDSGSEQAREAYKTPQKLQASAPSENIEQKPELKKETELKKEAVPVQQE